MGTVAEGTIRTPPVWPSLRAPESPPTPVSTNRRRRLLMLAFCAFAGSGSFFFLLVSTVAGGEPAMPGDWCWAWVVIWAVLGPLSVAFSTTVPGGIATAGVPSTAQGLVDMICPTVRGARADACVVCLDAVRRGEEARVLACRHAFHSRCIDEWWSCQPTKWMQCPLCRRSSSIGANW